MQKPVTSFVVLGGGSAGFLSALCLRVRFPTQPITLIRSPEVGIIGVGEGTFAFVPPFLHGYLNIDPTDYHARTQTTWKLGTRFEWGKRSHFFYTFDKQIDDRVKRLRFHNGYYLFDDMSDASISASLMEQEKAFAAQPNGAPDIRHTHGYHIENERFVGYLENVARQRNITIIEGTVEKVNQTDAGIESLLLNDGRVMAGDFFVDCSGFRSLLLEKAMGASYYSFKKTLYCDRAITGSWDRTDEPIKPFTTSETMDAGWCWRIEHPEKIIRGYVHSSDFISEEAATEEFLRKNPKVKKTGLVRWPSGYRPEAWIKNVVAIGNACGFVEPLEATNLAVICSQAKAVTDLLYYTDGQVTQSQIDGICGIFRHMWLNIRDFLGVHYRFNDRLETPFWRACVNDVDLGDAAPLVEYYKENGPDLMMRTEFERPQEQFGLEGFYCILMGLKVPFKKKIEITDAERAIWNEYRTYNRTRAAAGLTVEQAKKIISMPQWSWNPQFYDGSRPL